MGLPCWNVDYPFYSLMVVAGIAESAGIETEIADLNIRFYNLMPEPDRLLWVGTDPNEWLPGGSLPVQLFERHKELFTAEIIAAVSKRNYGMILLSVNMSNRFFSEKAIAIIKHAYPDIPVLFGGVDCFPKEYGKKFFSLAVPPDMICQGEAEIALPTFLARYAADGKLPSDVAGFAGYCEGTFVDTGEPVLPDVKKNAPLPSLAGIDFASYRTPGDFPIYSSRGCINRCKFCSESPNFKHFRFRKAEQTFAELAYVYEQASRYNICPSVHFADSLINGSITELEKFCRLIIASGITVKWAGQAFFREEMTTELLALMREAGCCAFFWGLESGAQTVIDLMGKNYSLDVAKTIINECHRLQIANYLPLIVGFPGETPELLAETARFVDEFKSKATFLGPNCCCVRPNSPLYESFPDFGLASNDYTEWCSTDQTNTPTIRKVRAVLITCVLQGDLYKEGAVDKGLTAFGLKSSDAIVAGELKAFFTHYRLN